MPSSPTKLTRQETTERRILRERSAREWRALLPEEPALRLKLASMIWWDYFSQTPENGDRGLYNMTLEWLFSPKWDGVEFAPEVIETELHKLGFGPLHARRRAFGEKRVGLAVQQH